MNKVAVLTWVADTHNYGSILQAYAMQHYLEMLGYNVNFIYYKSIPDDLEYPSKVVIYTQKIFNRMKKIISGRYITDKRLAENYQICKEFVEKEISLTKKYIGRKALEELNDYYDVFICGSDQIWSLNVRYNPAYYLDWVHMGKMKIAYAPSIPLDYLTRRKALFLKENVKNFVALSVREQKSAEILSTIINVPVKSVLDPTLLVGREFWRDLLKKTRLNKNKEKYIICYLLGHREFYDRHIAHLLKLTGYSVRIIPTGNDSYRYGYELCDHVGPIQFLELINNAEIVLTDSYHAMIFSIIFQKNFYLFERFERESKKSQNVRIYDLIQKLSLENYVIDSHTQMLRCCETIEFSTINSHYEDLRIESENFLYDALMKSFTNSTEV